ncbi:CASP-like protein 4A3 [Coffea eugenioides]|uniref:CASP-like protein 4A3 n=1 Tax=Coffea eugenioides TaxID=49369 RepID=UPI000F605024|nr:CASP-like protein 4A3 [Coffea eugenioides]
MENPSPSPNPSSTPPTAANHQHQHQHQHTNSSSTATPRKNFKSDSHKSTRSTSMSDTESQVDSFHSPLRSISPLHSDDPVFKSPSDSKAIVSVDKYFSPLRSPKKPWSENSSFPATPLTADGGGKDGTGNPSQGMMMFNRSVRDGVQPGVEKLEMGLGRRGERDEVGGERPSRAAVDSILRRSNRDVMVKKSALGFRICEVILCLIAFSVMAADKTQGWSGDSFDRYKEYRYLVGVNVIGFVYSGFQACCLAYYLATGNHVISSPLRYFFDFFMDQILAYLIMSASSSSATRVDDWVSNWGKDEFTEMAAASISISFLAFFAFAFNSLICGYSLCNRDSS